MGWILWLLLFAAAAADLVLLVLLLRMRDKMQKQQRTDHKALKREKQELTAIRRELCHERDIIGLIQEHMVEGILILDDSDKIQLANRTAVAQLRIADLCHYVERICCDDFHMFGCNRIYGINCFFHIICHKNISVIVQGLLDDLFSGKFCDKLINLCRYFFCKFLACGDQNCRCHLIMFCLG